MKDLKGVKAKLRELLGGDVILNTDEYTIYEGIAEKIEWIKEHRMVNHSRGEWSRGEAHVNGCENRNGFLRTYLRKHRGVSKEYLQGYLDFLSLLLNERGRWFGLLISDYLKARAKSFIPMRFSLDVKKLAELLFPSRILKYIKDTRRQIRNFKILAIEYGQFGTIRNWACTDKNGNPVPWFTYPTIEYLNCLDLSECSVFEFGMGYSTLYWLSKTKKVISIEHNENWYNKIMKLSLNNENLTCYLFKNENEYVSALEKFNQFFDIIVIDGRWRRKCAENAVRHIKSFGGGMLIFDNSDWYPNTINFLRNELKWIEIDFAGFGPINNYTWVTTIFINPEYRLKYYKNLSSVGGLIQLAEDDQKCSE